MFRICNLKLIYMIWQKEGIKIIQSNFPVRLRKTRRLEWWRVNKQILFLVLLSVYLEVFTRCSSCHIHWNFFIYKNHFYSAVSCWCTWIHVHCCFSVDSFQNSVLMSLISRVHCNYLFKEKWLKCTYFFHPQFCLLEPSSLTSFSH